MSSNSANLESQLIKLKLLGDATAADLWPFLNVCMLTWGLLVFAPRWTYTPTISLIPPLLHAVVYVGGILSLVFFPGTDEPNKVDFFSLEGVVDGFKDPNGVFVGWVHYVVFDALVGRMITFDSIKRGATTMQHICLVVPCLFFTLMLGPSGWLAYQILSLIFLKQEETSTKIKAS